MLVADLPGLLVSLLGPASLFETRDFIELVLSLIVIKVESWVSLLNHNLIYLINNALWRVFKREGERLGLTSLCCLMVDEMLI